MKVAGSGMTPWDEIFEIISQYHVCGFKQIARMLLSKLKTAGRQNWTSHQSSACEGVTRIHKRTSLCAFSQVIRGALRTLKIMAIKEHNYSDIFRRKELLWQETSVCFESRRRRAFSASASYLGSPELKCRLWDRLYWAFLSSSRQMLLY
jgi:hypothetical protein